MQATSAVIEDNQLLFYVTEGMDKANAAKAFIEEQPGACVWVVCVGLMVVVEVESVELTPMS